MTRALLSAKMPKLAAQWHPALNSVTPDQVSFGSGLKVWWRCPAGHEWMATVTGRTHGSGCPSCARKAFTPIPPHVVAQWHPTLNVVDNTRDTDEENCIRYRERRV